MFVVVAYDIADDKRRLRVMKLLAGYGEHVQESVFECDLAPALYRQLLQRLEHVANLKADHIEIYHLRRADVERTVHLGIGEPVRRAAVTIV